MNNQLRLHGRVKPANIGKIALLFNPQRPTLSLVYTFGFELLGGHDVRDDIFVGPKYGIIHLNLELFWLKLEVFNGNVVCRG